MESSEVYEKKAQFENNRENKWASYVSCGPEWSGLSKI